MKGAFGADVATLVDGVTKLGKLPFKSFEDYQAENLRKMFVVWPRTSGWYSSSWLTDCTTCAPWGP